MSARTLVSGVINFRDVGGLPASDGITRSGVLYRSGNLARVDEVGRGHFDGLGIARIIDLRDDDEVVRDPSLAGAVPIERVPLFLGSVSSFFVNDMSLSEMYAEMVEGSAERVITAVRGILHTQPVLVHCTIGKDRTGVTVALALAAAGVDEDAVVEDYARTAGNLPAERNAEVRARLGKMFPASRHLEELTMHSPAPVMRGLLDDLRARYGSPADYLRAKGLSDDEVLGLREVLIESRAHVIS